MRQAEVLRRVFPGVVVSGANYPPPLWKQTLGTVLQYTVYGMMAYIFLGTTVLKSMGVQEPPWLERLRGNRMMLLGGYFGLNMAASQLLSSGAFEVMLNGRALYSKLATGRPPTVQEVAMALVQAGLIADPSAAAAYGLMLGTKGVDPTVAVPTTPSHADASEFDFAPGQATI